MGERATNTLAIVGASARAAAFSAMRAGFHVVTADLFADADLAKQVSAHRVSHYPGDFLPWLRERRVSGWMYTGALENYPRLVDQMARVVPLLGNAGRQLRAVRSPVRLAKSLSEAGLSFPEVALPKQGIPSDGTWLRKPFRGSNGAGIELWAGQRSETSRHPFLQRRVSGTPCAALFVASAGKSRLLGVTRQLVGEAWTGAKPFQYAGSIGPWQTTALQLDQIERIGEALTSVFALRGLFGVDLVIDGDTVWVVEVNPRYTAAAEVVERFSGVNPIAAHVACEGEGWVARPESAKGVVASVLSTPIEDSGRATLRKTPGVSAGSFGKAILYAENDLTIAQKFFEWAIERSGPNFADGLADIPHAGTEIRAGHPILTVLADGESPDKVETKLKSLIEEVELSLSRERREME